MKNSLVLFLACLFMGLAPAHGQSDSATADTPHPDKCCEKGDCKKKQNTSIKHELRFDFAARKSISLPKKIKRGEFYSVVVEGVNPNIYTIQLKTKDTTYQSQALSFPVFGGLDLTSIPLSFASLVKEKQDNGLPQKMVELRPFKTNKRSLQEVLDSAEIRLTLLNEALEKHQEELLGINYDFIELRILARSKKLGLLEKDSINVREKLDEFRLLRGNLNQVNQELESLAKALTAYFKKPEVIDALAKKPSLKTQKTEVEKVLSTKQKETKKLLAQVSPAQVEKAIVSVYQLYNEDTYRSLPIQLNGDEAIVSMSFIPRDSTSNLQTEHLPKIRFGKSKWYWSVGPSLYYSGLSSQRIGFRSIQINDSTLNYSPFKEEKIRDEIGAAVLFHAGYELLPVGNTYLGLHLSVGTALSLGEESRARALFGGGISLGDRHKLSLDAGLALGHVDRIGNNITESEEGFDTVYPAIPDNAIITKLESSGFISLGYMFSF